VAGIRDRIRMDRQELARFLREERTVTCATVGRDGLPHLMPLWYVVRGDDLWAWTYAKSQKVRNLERDPRATLQVEAGERYEELRGAMLRADVAIHRDHDTVLALGMELLLRYGGDPDEAARRGVLTQVPKRVALQFLVRDVVSWDHRKFTVHRGASS
jgi:PPOX class probable F420-dependent enzyme